MPSECFGTRPDVHRHIPNPALGATNEFGLSRAGLEMQPSQGASRGTAVVVLDKRFSDAGLQECVPIITFEKPSAIVLENAGMENAKTFQGSFRRFHIDD